MIASLDRQFDIDVYLDTEELSELENKVIEGVIIKFQKPKQQGQIYVSVNNERCNENGCGVVSTGYSRTEVGTIELFLSTAAYKNLKEEGRFGARHSVRDGSKVHLYERSRCEYPYSAEHLEHYRDNRDRLPADFG